MDFGLKIRKFPFVLGQVGAALIGLAGVLIWSYWPIISPLFQSLYQDENYSAGLLVPFVCLWLLWNQRADLARAKITRSWLGLVLLLVAQGIRIFGLLFFYSSAENYSLVLTIAGLVLMLAGKEIFSKVFWILAFLFLMIPLPKSIHLLTSGFLQQTATSGAVFLLETFGLTVTQSGNVITLDPKTSLEVAEACSGLRLLTAFFIVGAVFAYIANCPRWQKVILIASSVPIAVACNILRLFITGELYHITNSEVIGKTFHDFAGWGMMPVAITILFAELLILKKLIISDVSTSKIKS